MTEVSQKLAEDVLAILICPVCGSSVQAAQIGLGDKAGEQGDSVLCTNGDCRRSYPYKDGIAVLLAEEAEVLPAETWQDALGSI